MSEFMGQLKSSLEIYSLNRPGKDCMAEVEDRRKGSEAKQVLLKAKTEDDTLKRSTR